MLWYLLIDLSQWKRVDTGEIKVMQIWWLDRLGSSHCHAGEGNRRESPVIWSCLLSVTLVYNQASQWSPYDYPGWSQRKPCER